MKKHVYALLCAVLCSLLFPSAALSANSGYGLVMDEADLLTDSEEEALSEMLEEISLKQGNDIVVVTVYSLGGKSAESFADDYFDYNGYGQGTAKSGVPCALLCLFLVVVLRSALGLAFDFSWKGSLALPFTLAVVLGKTCGGLLADRIGPRRTAILTLLASAVLFVFSGVPAAGLAAVFLFNTTMPLTLHAASRLLPGAKGFSFGLLTFALFLGFLPGFFGAALPLSGAALYAAVALFSLPLLLAGLKKTPC